MTRLLWSALAFVVLVGLLAPLAGRPSPALAEKAAKEKKEVKADPAAVERTRETIKMLDDLYKLSIVHVTNTYVKARERTPAARVAKLVFKDMASKGWHTVRLIDATGEPINKKNVAETSFEKRALAKLKKGEKYYEELATVKDKAVLRAATAVPVVMKSCIDCHPGLKEGKLMGALTYELPVK
jgi:hypothetical protein